MTSPSFTTIHVFDTVCSADSVEWCPITPHRTSFVCGTYHLVDTSNNCRNDKNGKGYERTGGVTLFTLFKDQLEVNDSIKCPAVLDMKWCNKRIEDKVVLAVANAIGEVVLYQLEDKALKFVTKCVLKKDTGDFLTLSLDWNKSGSEILICSSDSKGNITVIKFENEILSVIKQWNSHPLEAWIVNFDSFNSNIVFSGGDEGVLKVWDWRTESSSAMAFSKCHTAGVTALSSNLFKKYYLVSGSYDENIFLWDTRNWKNPTKTISASGGLWRLKWEPHSRSRYLLAACIYGGFQIFDMFSYVLVGEYKEHESLAYGADWCHLNGNEIKDQLGFHHSAVVATCSFYDHKLSVALWNENEEGK